MMSTVRKHSVLSAYPITATQNAIHVDLIHEIPFKPNLERTPLGSSMTFQNVVGTNDSGVFYLDSSTLPGVLYRPLRRHGRSIGSLNG